MERITIIILSILMFKQIHLVAQEKSQNTPKIGITYTSLGANEVFRFTRLDGAGSFESKGFYAIGLNYIQPINHWLEFETGLEYTKQNFSILPNVPPHADGSAREEELNLMNIPLTARANFLQYFFINGGLILDIDISKSSSLDNQTGIGTLLGVGAKYDFRNGMSVFINPYFRFHSLIPFVSTRYHQRAFDTGFRFGLEFPLRRK